jgi:hypothetical protein
LGYNFDMGFFAWCWYYHFSICLLKCRIVTFFGY